MVDMGVVENKLHKIEESLKIKNIRDDGIYACSSWREGEVLTSTLNLGSRMVP